VIIDWAHSVPFTKFYQKAFVDMADLFSVKIAAKEGLGGEALQARAAEILRDAARIEPETAEGRAVRSASQQQAARVTNTNSTWASRMALGIKDLLNKQISGLGDIMMPIAKIPANIVANGLENAGGGFVFGARDIFQGRAKIQSADLATRYEGMAQFAQGIQRLGRTTGSLGAAAFLASQLSASDFRQDRYGTNFVKIGGVWINMEYISAISPALAGMMTVKAKSNPGQGIQDTFSQYVKGAAAPLRELPGAKEINDLVAEVTNLKPGEGIGKPLADFAESRLMPAFLANLLKDRPIERLFFGAHGVETPQEVLHDSYQRAVSKTQEGMTVWGQPAGSPDNDPTNLQLEKIGYTPEFPKNTINGVRLTPTQYHDYVQIRGRLAKQILDGAVNNGAWQQLPHHLQVSSVRSIVEGATKQAQALIMQEDPTIFLRAAQNKITVDTEFAEAH
jgi:Tfp pilus assembly protein PilO